LDPPALVSVLSDIAGPPLPLWNCPRGADPYSRRYPRLRAPEALVVVLDLVEDDRVRRVIVKGDRHDEVLLEGTNPELPSRRQRQAISERRQLVDGVLRVDSQRGALHDEDLPLGGDQLVHLAAGVE